MGRLRIAVLAGGWSGEREVSLGSGRTVCEALDRHKYDVTLLDPREELDELIGRKGEIDLAFNLLHGKLGEDGCIQGLLRILGISFLGSGVLSSAMALNKKVAKEMYRGAGLRVARDVVLHRGEGFSSRELMEELGPKSVVKPVSEGSSLGVSVCDSQRGLEEGIRRAFQYDSEVMVEQYLEGREVTCCVLGNRALEALPLVEIIPSSNYAFFDYEAKYKPGATQEVCPAQLPPELTVGAQDCAKTAHWALRCEVWSRTDLIVQGKQIYVLETNTLPGMTENSLVPRAARAAGLSLPQFLDKLIHLTLNAKG